MEKWGKPTWNAEWLKKARWVEFRDLCEKNYTLNVKDEMEAYELYQHLTGKTVVGMERKKEALKKKQEKEALEKSE